MKPMAAGWYNDPVTVGGVRYWDGQRWTNQVVVAGRTVDDRTPLAEVERRWAADKAAACTGKATEIRLRIAGGPRRWHLVGRRCARGQPPGRGSGRPW